MDPLSLLLGDVPDSADARALAEAMRQRSGLGATLQFAANPRLAAAGRGIQGDVASQQDLLVQALLGRQRGDLAKQEAERRQAEQAAEAQRNSARDAEQRRQFGLNYGLKKQELDLEREKLNRPAPPKAPDVASADELRKEFQGQQGYKDFRQVETAYKKIQSTSETGAGDMSLIFGYMKLLDPNSTVREGEYATAANAGSVPQSVLATYNKIVSGEKLAPGVRKQFKDESTRVYGAQKAQFDALAAPYIAYAKKNGIPPEDVIFGYSEQAAPDAQVDPQDAAAKAWADANPNDPRAAAILAKLKAKGL